MTQVTETITSTRVTAYTYDVTSRLSTSKVDVESTTWYYRFDGNGNLVEMTPNGSNPGNGAIRYSYDTASQLKKVETHNGTVYSVLTQMGYDGLGNRARLIAWAAGVPMTTTYATRIAGQVQILEATSGSITTAYLYGLSPLGEFGSQSVYYLTDGTGSVRQLVDPNGAVKLTRLYEPFGQVLMQKGTSDPAYGYLGVQVDRITGLLYINGRYYDPVTGRFLTPSGSEQNPYAPYAGAALAPILILALLRRKKKGQIWTGWLVLAVMASVGLGLVACGGGSDQGSSTPRPTTNPQPITTPPTSTPISTPTAEPQPPTAEPLSSPTPTCTATPGSTSTPSPTPGHPAYTAQELDVAARIVSQEVGVGQYFRGPDDKVVDASRAVAWTMRNRIEVGEELQGPYAPFSRRESSYTDTFKYYDPYTIGPLPTTPDPLVLETVRGVFDATNRESDPLQGAIFFLSLQAYNTSGRKESDSVYTVKWTPLLNPTPEPGTTQPPPEYGLVFFKK